jgi:2-polyprenyl-3-methyl-5-hydroxy-6-metoxy-1,4-benzoquinol methylase
VNRKERPPAGPAAARRRLRYTGSAGREEFERKVAAVPWWYHSYFFDNGLAVRGDYDIGADVDSYGLPDSMEGMRVLDMGTGSGWFAFYFEQLGAEVVTADARGECDLDVYGRWEAPQPEGPPDEYDAAGRPIYYSYFSKGFPVMRDLLGSRVEFRNARVYDLSLEMFGGRGFDLVFLGAILCHLRDPIGALLAARRVCRGRVLASTPVVLGEKEADTMPRQYLPYTAIDPIGWWLPNEGCFRHWFLAAGFRDPDVSRVITLRGDVEHRDARGRIVNLDQTLRVGIARV